jgi:transposase
VKYYGKDCEERALKQMKGAFDPRPVRVWLNFHIECNVKICYLAYSILSYFFYILEKKEISGSEVIVTMRTYYRVYLEVQKFQLKWESTVALSLAQR